MKKLIFVALFSGLFFTSAIFPQSQSWLVQLNCPQTHVYSLKEVATIEEAALACVEEELDLPACSAANDTTITTLTNNCINQGGFPTLQTKPADTCSCSLDTDPNDPEGHFAYFCGKVMVFLCSFNN